MSEFNSVLDGIYCTQHELCEHFEIECTCEFCWTSEAQCPYTELMRKPEDIKKNLLKEFEECENTDDELIAIANAVEQTYDMDRRETGEGAISIHSQSTRNEDLHCTEEIRNTPPISPPDSIYREPGNSSTERNNNSNTQERLRSRTPEIPTQPLPSTSETGRKRNMDIPDEHIQPKTKNRLINKYHTENITVTSSENIGHMDPDGKYTATTKNVLGSSQKYASDNVGNAKGHNNKTSTRSTTPGNRSNDDTTTIPMEQHDKHGNDSKPPAKPRKRRTSGGEGTSKKRQETASNTTSDDQKTTHYTFVIHKRNQEPNWRGKPGPQPSFITFDHGDHLHIIYTTTGDGSNTARARKRIADFLHATTGGHTEIIASNTKIKLLENFILYCIRYGLKTINQYGTKIVNLMRKVEDLLTALTGEVDEIDNEGICRQYIEEARDGREKIKRVGKNKLTNLTDVILEQIEDKNIRTVTDWEKQVDNDLKIQLIREFGISTDTYIKHIIRIKKYENKQHMRNTPYIELLLNKYERQLINNKMATEDDFEDNLQYFMETIEWIEKWMKQNEINMNTLFAWYIMITDKTLTKINTFALQGPTNAGKSLLMRTLTSILEPETIPKEHDNNAFRLDQLPMATSVLFEEPLIGPNNVIIECPV